MASSTKAEDALSLATARILCGPKASDAFYATLLVRLRREPRDDIETAATDGRRLLYNPAFIESLPEDQVVGLLKHEVAHVAHLHHLRRGDRDPLRWNVACDLAINQLLSDDGVKLPAGICLPGVKPFQKHPKDESAERHYELLEGGAVKRVPWGEIFDPDGSYEALEAEAKLTIAQAAHAALKRGQLPGGLDRLVSGMFAPPKANWRDLLRHFVSAHARNDYCWSVPNRKLMQQGIHAPGLYSDELGHVVVAIDTSGSIDNDVLKDFAAELDGILGAYDCTATILYCDAAVHRADEWKSGDGLLTLRPVGGGGTSHRPVWRWIEESGVEPVCAIALTDLYTDHGDEPPYPVLWATTGETKAPWGQVVAL